MISLPPTTHYRAARRRSGLSGRTRGPLGQGPNTMGAGRATLPSPLTHPIAARLSKISGTTATLLRGRRSTFSPLYFSLEKDLIPHHPQKAPSAYKEPVRTSQTVLSSLTNTFEIAVRQSRPPNGRAATSVRLRLVSVPPMVHEVNIHSPLSQSFEACRSDPRRLTREDRGLSDLILRRPSWFVRREKVLPQQMSIDRPIVGLAPRIFYWCVSYFLGLRESYRSLT